MAPPLSHQRNFNRVLCYVTDNNCAPFISRLVIHGRASVAIRHATRKVNPLVIAVKGSWENGLAITLRLKKKRRTAACIFSKKKFDVISKFQAAPTPRENFNRSVKCQGNFSSSRSTREFRYCAEGWREMERERCKVFRGVLFILLRPVRKLFRSSVCNRFLYVTNRVPLSFLCTLYHFILDESDNWSVTRRIEAGTQQAFVEARWKSTVEYGLEAEEWRGKRGDQFARTNATRSNVFELVHD